jgi:chloramphenicol-sensitive protein RarD
MNIGILYAVSAFIVWGLIPLYFKMLQAISPVEILAQRTFWSLVFLLGVLAARNQWSWIRDVARRPRVLAAFTASAFLLAINWGVYIWACNNDRIIDASLGYFINPLFNVLLGLLFLRERLRPGQWTAIGLAAAGVAWLTWQAGHPPWIGLVLAGTFSIYGLLRKIAVLGALEGLSLETALLLPLAAGYLLLLAHDGRGAFVTEPALSQWLVLASGPLTAIPLLLFAAGARRIPLSVLGILQYAGPTLQLLLAVWLYHEPFGGARLAGFALIWLGLALYSAESAWRAWSGRGAQA